MTPTAEARARAHEEAQAVLARVLGTAPPPKAKRPSKARFQPSQRGSNLKNRPPKYDRSEVFRLAAEGLRVKEICERTGAHRSTISKILNEAGVANEDHGGPTRRKMCGKGLHDMDIHGREVKGGGRYCVVCKSERGKKAWRNRQN